MQNSEKLQQQKQVLELIIRDLNKVSSLHEKLEVLANLFIDLGISQIPNFNPEEVVTIDSLWDFVVKDKKQHGETIENALIHQGLLLLDWTAKIEKERKTRR